MFRGYTSSNIKNLFISLLVMIVVPSWPRIRIKTDWMDLISKETNCILTFKMSFKASHILRVKFDMSDCFKIHYKSLCCLFDLSWDQNMTLLDFNFEKLTIYEDWDAWVRSHDELRKLISLKKTIWGQSNLSLHCLERRQVSCQESWDVCMLIKF